MKIKLLKILMICCVLLSSETLLGQQNKPNTDTSFWEVDNSEDNDTVLIFCEGGPKWDLDFKRIGKTIYRYIKNYKDYTVVYVHQSQTLDKRIFEMKRNLTFEEAKKEKDKTTKMLKSAIDYYKGKGKEVIVIGKSYGAYVIQDYLSKYPSKADKYFVNAGRLDINKEMTIQQLKGFNGVFAKDGLTYLPEDEKADTSEYSEQEMINYQKKQMLKAAYGSDNYIEKLKDIDLSNVTYFYGSVDENIGSLTQKEINFLKAKNVKIHTYKTDHSGMTRRIIDYINESGF